MACLTGENQTTGGFMTAPHPSSLSIAHGFQQDVTENGVLDNQTTIVLRTAPLHGLKQDVTKKGEDTMVLDNQMATVLLRTAPLHGLKQGLLLSSVWAWMASCLRKCSSYEAYDQVEEELEELENLMKCSREMVPPPEDREKFGNYCKKTCRRAHAFTKLESREEHLQSLIDSLRKREKVGRLKLPTQNEILGYMLLREIANSTLHNTSRELLDSITLSSASVDVDERDKNIHVEFNDLLYMEHATAKYNFEDSLASRYNVFVMNAKSDCNNSNNEVEQIKQMLAIVEELISEGNKCIVNDMYSLTISDAERRYERELFMYCEDLSYYMRLGRCLYPVSKTEDDRLKEIRDLACDAIDKCILANGPDSLLTITQPLLPTWRN